MKNCIKDSLFCIPNIGVSLDTCSNTARKILTWINSLNDKLETHLNKFPTSFVSGNIEQPFFTEDRKIYFNTINGKSILGNEDIHLDLGLFIMPPNNTLPSNTSEIEVNKIYLIRTDEGNMTNEYAEYIYRGALEEPYLSSNWEKLGFYNAGIELRNYPNQFDFTENNEEVCFRYSNLLGLDDAIILPTASATSSGILTKRDYNDLTNKTNKAIEKGLFVKNSGFEDDGFNIYFNTIDGENEIKVNIPNVREDFNGFVDGPILDDLSTQLSQVYPQNLNIVKEEGEGKPRLFLRYYITTEDLDSGAVNVEIPPVFTGRGSFREDAHNGLMTPQQANKLNAIPEISNIVTLTMDQVTEAYRNIVNMFTV